MCAAPRTDTLPRIGEQAEPSSPSPILFFEAINAFRSTAALKAALDLDVFTAIAEGSETAEAVARRCHASTRGIRILCDALCAMGFIAKSNGLYALTHDSFVFLNRRSPAYVGSAADFLASPDMLDAFRTLPDAVRSGTRDNRELQPDNPIWVKFARAMAPVMVMPAAHLADLVDARHAGRIRVLDVAAGHGRYGIAVATANTEAEITAVDWAPVLEVAKANADMAGIGARYRALPGDAMALDLGGDYDLVLISNFLHHFEWNTCVTFLRKVKAALRAGGRVAGVEWVPDEDRVTPHRAATFALAMLAMTPAGDAYTLSEFKRMFAEAGFRTVTLHEVPPMQRAFIAST
jgi:2-polyprenyl-3-methyl-5-hydroxy-6-metoxy-1,4-benzoquinol methylase